MIKMYTAVITGASSGLGAEFLKVLSVNKDVDEIWIIARRADRLEKLKDKYKSKNIVCIPADITNEEGLDSYRLLLADRKPNIKYLINNAGCGRIGEFYGSDSADQCAMVELNCRALTAVTAITLPYMKSFSGVLNVCSIAGFVPNPYMTVYSSTKAYILSFSRALRFELKKRGINVLAVCPGPMKTEFLPKAGIEKGVSKAFDQLPYCEPYSVAKNALNALDKGHAVYTPRSFYKFYRLLAKVLPHSVVMHLSKV